MKIDVTDEKNGFNPIELKITIESRDELLSLWHTFYTNRKDILSREYYPGIFVELPKSFDMSKLWICINNLATKRGFKDE